MSNNIKFPAATAVCTCGVRSPRNDILVFDRLDECNVANIVLNFTYTCTCGLSWDVKQPYGR